MKNRFALLQSAPNLIKNGGFETKDMSFWRSNFNVAVITENVTEKLGCRSYGSFVITSDTPAEVYQYFGDHNNRYVDYAQGEKRMDARAGLTTLERYFVTGCDISIGFSIRVIGGAVSISASFLFSDGTTEFVGISSDYASALWSRFAGSKTIGDKKLEAIGIKIERVTGNPAVNVGNFAAIQGKYSSVPYTGCLFSEAIPKNAIILALGSTAPEGFDILDGDITYFPRNGKNIGEQGGVAHHNHVLEQLMRDHTGRGQDDDYYRRRMLDDKEMTILVDIDGSWLPGVTNTGFKEVTIRGDDGAKPHTHTIESPGGENSDNTTPIWRGYKLCRKK